MWSAMVLSLVFILSNNINAMVVTPGFIISMGHEMWYTSR